MRMKWIAGAVLACSLAAPSFAQVGVGIYIHRTPPPLRVETPPPSPGPDYVWTEGYWNWDGGRYVWIGGRWNRRPYEGAYWIHPHYDHYDRGWQYHEGHWGYEHEGDWDHHDHDNHDDHDRH